MHLILFSSACYFNFLWCLGLAMLQRQGRATYYITQYILLFPDFPFCTFAATAVRRLRDYGFTSFSAPPELRYIAQLPGSHESPVDIRDGRNAPQRKNRLNKGPPVNYVRGNIFICISTQAIKNGDKQGGEIYYRLRRQRDSLCGVRAHRRNFSRMAFALFPTRVY